MLCSTVQSFVQYAYAQNIFGQCLFRIYMCVCLHVVVYSMKKSTEMPTVYLKLCNEGLVFLIIAFCFIFTFRAQCVVFKYPVHYFFNIFRWWDITKNFFHTYCG